MKGRSIDDAYYKAHIVIIEERIEKAGIRLAGVLNEVFKNGLVGDDGKSTTVCDKVYSTKILEGSQMIFLNLGGEYPHQKLTIVIKGRNRDKFKVSPEIAFRDKTICVTGVMSDYNGKPEMIVTDPDQIKVE
jgi:micrococcal nuclease